MGQNLAPEQTGWPCTLTYIYMHIISIDRSNYQGYEYTAVVVVIYEYFYGKLYLAERMDDGLLRTTLLLTPDSTQQAVEVLLQVSRQILVRTLLPLKWCEKEDSVS